VKTINPAPKKDERSAPETVVDALTRVLAQMLVEERLKKEFRRLRSEPVSGKRAHKRRLNLR
jgi:hypothetical protein